MLNPLNTGGFAFCLGDNLKQKAGVGGDGQTLMRKYSACISSWVPFRAISQVEKLKKWRKTNSDSDTNSFISPERWPLFTTGLPAQSISFKTATWKYLFLLCLLLCMPCLKTLHTPKGLRKNCVAIRGRPPTEKLSLFKDRLFSEVPFPLSGEWGGGAVAWDPGSKPKFLPPARCFFNGQRLVWPLCASLGKVVKNSRFGARENPIVALLQGKKAAMQQSVLHLDNVHTSQLAPEGFSHIIEDHLLYHCELMLYTISVVARHHSNWFSRQRWMNGCTWTRPWQRRRFGKLTVLSLCHTLVSSTSTWLPFEWIKFLQPASLHFVSLAEKGQDRHSTAQSSCWFTVAFWKWA